MQFTGTKLHIHPTSYPKIHYIIVPTLDAHVAGRTITARTYGQIQSCPIPQNIKSRSSSSSHNSSGSIRSGLVQCREISRAEAVAAVAAAVAVASVRCREISRAEALATVAAAVAVSGLVLSDAVKYQEQKQ